MCGTGFPPCIPQVILGLLAHKTRVVITHQLRFVRHPAVDTVIVLGVGGHVLATGTFDDVKHTLPADLTAEVEGEGSGAAVVAAAIASGVASAAAAEAADGATEGGAGAKPSGALGAGDGVGVRSQGLARLLIPGASGGSAAGEPPKKGVGRLCLAFMRGHFGNFGSRKAKSYARVHTLLTSVVLVACGTRTRAATLQTSQGKGARGCQRIP